MAIQYKCDSVGRCYVRDKLPNWEQLRGCFRYEYPEGSGYFKTLTPCDLDGFLQQRGYCLFLERKGRDHIGRPIDLEPVLLRGINALTIPAARGHTFITTWANDPLGTDITHMQIWDNAHGLAQVCARATLDDFRNVCREWWRRVYRPGEL